MRRREFLVDVGGIVLVTPALATLAGCGSQGGGDDDSSASADAAGPPSCTDFGAGAAGAAISANHGHVLNVPAEDVNTGTEKSYDIQGTATHDHTVTVTADDFTSLQGGGSVTILSSTVAGHSHQVTVTCKSA